MSQLALQLPCKLPCLLTPCYFLLFSFTNGTCDQRLVITNSLSHFLRTGFSLKTGRQVGFRCRETHPSRSNTNIQFPIYATVFEGPKPQGSSLHLLFFFFFPPPFCNWMMMQLLLKLMQLGLFHFQSWAQKGTRQWGSAGVRLCSSLIMALPSIQNNAARGSTHRHLWDGAGFIITIRIGSRFLDRSSHSLPREMSHSSASCHMEKKTKQNRRPCITLSLLT